MDKRKLNGITWAVLAAAIILVALMLGSSLNRTAHITLPSSDPPKDPAAGDSGAGAALTVVEITPETVQAAISSLSRPESYGRSMTVEYLWDGGSGTHELYTIVRGPWTRVDRGLPTETPASASPTEKKPISGSATARTRRSRPCRREHFPPT